MSNRYEYQASSGEMERRWKLVSQQMAVEDIDCLLIGAYDNMLGGYYRYFTDLTVCDYPMAALFHRDIDLTVIGHGGVRAASVPELFTHRTGTYPATPMMPTLFYTDDYVPKLLADEIKKRNYKRVGIVAMATIPANVYKYLDTQLSGVELCDATDMVDRIKAIKSPEELHNLREAVKIHDKIIAAMPVICRPGKYEYEITSDIRKMAGDLGAECSTNVSLGSDASFPYKTMVPWQSKRLEYGDKIFCLIEVNGPGGGYAEILRIFSMGEPSKEFIHAAKTAAQCQSMLEGLLKPGTRCSDLFEANNEFLVSRGYFPETRLFGHGQGYDMVERPAFVAAETMSLKENMFVAMHPGAVNEKAIGITCDNYIITDSGCEKLNTTPDDLIIID